MFKTLIIDGKMSATGIRSPEHDYYIEPEDIGLEANLKNRLTVWLMAYELQHYHNYKNTEKILFYMLKD